MCNVIASKNCSVNIAELLTQYMYKSAIKVMEQSNVTSYYTPGMTISSYSFECNLTDDLAKLINEISQVRTLAILQWVKQKIEEQKCLIA